MKWMAVIALIAGLLAAGGLPSAAQDEAGWSYQLAHDVMSPYCPGLSLADCPSPNAASLREWIIEQERAGASQDSVEKRLFEQFGDGLLQAPRPEGVGLIAYAIPGAGLLVGGLLVARVIRRRGQSSPAEALPASKPPTSDTPPGDADLEREIDEEIGE